VQGIRRLAGVAGILDGLRKVYRERSVMEQLPLWAQFLVFLVALAGVFVLALCARRTPPGAERKPWTKDGRWR